VRGFSHDKVNDYMSDKDWHTHIIPHLRAFHIRKTVLVRFIVNQNMKLKYIQILASLNILIGVLVLILQVQFQLNTELTIIK